MTDSTQASTITDSRAARIAEYAARMVRSGRSLEEIERKIAAERLDDETSNAIMIAVLERKYRSAKTRQGWSAIFCLLGLVVTVTTVSIAMKSGGNYIIAFGAIIGGFLNMKRWSDRAAQIQEQIDARMIEEEARCPECDAQVQVSANEVARGWFTCPACEAHVDVAAAHVSLGGAASTPTEAPANVACPFCAASVELDDAERAAGRFTCPNCHANVVAAGEGGR